MIFYIQPSTKQGHWSEQTRQIIHVHILEATAHLYARGKMKFRHQICETDLNGGGYIGLYVIQDYMVERCTGRDRQTDRETETETDPNGLIDLSECSYQYTQHGTQK